MGGARASDPSTPASRSRGGPAPRRPCANGTAGSSACRHLCAPPGAAPPERLPGALAAPVQTRPTPRRPAGARRARTVLLGPRPEPAEAPREPPSPHPLGAAATGGPGEPEGQGARLPDPRRRSSVPGGSSARAPAPAPRSPRTCFGFAGASRPDAPPALKHRPLRPLAPGAPCAHGFKRAGLLPAGAPPRLRAAPGGAPRKQVGRQVLGIPRGARATPHARPAAGRL